MKGFNFLVSTSVFIHPRLWESFFSFPLVGQIAYSSLIFVFLFQWCRHCNDVFFTQVGMRRLSVTPKNQSTHPWNVQGKSFNISKRRGDIRCLLESIQSNHLSLKFAAFLDLQNVAMYDFMRRRSLYEIEQAWMIVQNQSCQVINNFTLRLEQASTHQMEQSDSPVTRIKQFLSASSKAKKSEDDSNRSLSRDEIFGESQLVIWAIKGTTCASLLLIISF